MMLEGHSDLEGKYILYKYLETAISIDSRVERSGSALALFRFERGEMKKVYHPRDHIDSIKELDVWSIDKLLNVMENKNIEKTYTVMHPRKMGQISTSWFQLEDVVEDGCTIWARYSPHLLMTQREREKLGERGITVENYVGHLPKR